MNIIMKLFCITCVMVLGSEKAFTDQINTNREPLILAEADKTKKLGTPIRKVASPSQPKIDKSIAKAKMKSPFKYEYKSSSLGGYFGRHNWDTMHSRDWIKCYVNNTSNKTPGDARIRIYATDMLGNTKLVKDSGVKRIRTNSFFFMEYALNESDRPSDRSGAYDYWVSISVSSDVMLPRVKSLKWIPRPSSNEHDATLKTIADYLPGDFAVYETDPYRRIW